MTSECAPHQARVAEWLRVRPGVDLPVMRGTLPAREHAARHSAARSGHSSGRVHAAPVRLWEARLPTADEIASRRISQMRRDADGATVGRRTGHKYARRVGRDRAPDSAELWAAGASDEL